MIKGHPRYHRLNLKFFDFLFRAQIETIEAANEYAAEFIEDYNARFAEQPRSSHDMHRVLLPTEDLERDFTLQEQRTLSKNLTLQYKKVVYQIQTPRPSYAMRNAPVTVCERENDQIEPS